MKDQLKNLLIRFHDCKPSQVFPLQDNSNSDPTVRRQRLVNLSTDKRSGHKQLNSFRNN